MSADEWSWLAAAASIVGLWISGSNPRRGWAYGIACQGLYVAYGLATDQNGMIFLSFAFTALYLRNLKRSQGMALAPVVAVPSSDEIAVPKTVVEVAA